MRRALITTCACLLAAGGAVAGDTVPAPTSGAAQTSASERELFEMCCWARGRSGFNYGTEYGSCVDNPGQLCKGRGAAEGLQMRCEAPPEEQRSGAMSADLAALVAAHSGSVNRP